jgi:hypothetical protein
MERSSPLDQYLSITPLPRGGGFLDAPGGDNGGAVTSIRARPFDPPANES